MTKHGNTSVVFVSASVMVSKSNNKGKTYFVVMRTFTKKRGHENVASATHDFEISSLGHQGELHPVPMCIEKSEVVATRCFQRLPLILGAGGITRPGRGETNTKYLSGPGSPVKETHGHHSYVARPPVYSTSATGKHSDISSCNVVDTNCNRSF